MNNQGSNESRIEYNWINVYVDYRNPNQVWASIHYTQYRRTRSVLKEEIKQFKDYNEMMTFLRSNFNCYELDHYVRFLERKIFIHNVDYLHANYLMFDSNPSDNHFEVTVREYYGNGSYKDRVITFEPRYRGMIMELIRNNHGLPKNAKLGSDLYQVINVNEMISERSNPTERVSRREVRLQREKNSMPMPAPKERHPIRNLIIYLSTLVTVFGVAKGISLHSRHSDTTDGILIDRIADFGDFKLLWNKGHAGSIIEKLVRGEYKDVSEKDVRDVIEYLEELEKSNYDRNPSLHSIMLSEYKYDIGLNPGTSTLLDKLDSKYQECFNRPNAKNDNYEIYPVGAKRFLDFTLPLILMNNTYYQQRSISSVPRNLESYNSNHPTQQDIDAYNSLPEIIKVMIDKKVRWMLSRIDEYELSYTYYFGRQDKDGLLGAITEITHKDQESVYYLQSRENKTR